ncbi:MAG: hypothetical protein HRT61_12330 [Ekhidna sp.]|nr:hypothetical protein [Ekhidna sp.]
MKTKLFALFITLVAFANAQVTIVDNNGNAPAGVETSLSTAITNATAGDTLLIIPSTTNYGNISIDKELTIIGVGFNPDMDIFLTSTVGSVTLQTAASGTKLIGLVLTGTLVFGNAAGTLSDLVIENNKLSYISYSGSLTSLVNVLVRQNVITPTSSGFDIQLSVTNQSNILFSNNVFSNLSTSTIYRGASITTGGVTFDHNTFMGTSSQRAFYDIRNCLVTNNIFVTINPSAEVSSTNNVVYRNNLSNTVDAFSSLNGTNITVDSNIEDEPAFVNLPNTTVTYTYDLDPTLTTGPGQNGATDGTDIGVTGGTSAFKLSGSTLPVVKRFDFPSSIIEGNDVDATIEVTGN